MRNKLEKQARKITSLVKYMKLNTILPFTEKPATETELDAKKEPGQKDKLAASDLFSLFTADIIKEDVVFTR